MVPRYTDTFAKPMRAGGVQGRRPGGTFPELKGKRSPCWSSGRPLMQAVAEAGISPSTLGLASGRSQWKRAIAGSGVTGIVAAAVARRLGVRDYTTEA